MTDQKKIATVGKANEINQLHLQTQKMARNAIQAAVRIGELLSEVRQDLEHGQWTPWIEANLDFSVRQAQKYLKIYENRDLLKANSSSHLTSINDAIGLLSEPHSQRPDVPESEDAGFEGFFWLRKIYIANGMPEAWKAFKTEMTDTRWRLQQDHWVEFYHEWAMQEKLDTKEDLSRFTFQQIEESSLPDGPCYDGAICRAIITGWILQLMYRLSMNVAS